MTDKTPKKPRPKDWHTGPRWNDPEWVAAYIAARGG